jgi:hypothetical protein
MQSIVGFYLAAKQIFLTNLTIDWSIAHELGEVEQHLDVQHCSKVKRNKKERKKGLFCLRLFVCVNTFVDVSTNYRHLQYP